MAKDATGTTTSVRLYVGGLGAVIFGIAATLFAINKAGWLPGSSESDLGVRLAIGFVTIGLAYAVQRYYTRGGRALQIEPTMSGPFSATFHRYAKWAVVAVVLAAVFASQFEALKGSVGEATFAAAGLALAVLGLIDHALFVRFRRDSQPIA